MPNAPYQPIKLSLMAASREFKTNRPSLRVKLGDTQPDENGYYSILQIASAIFGNSKNLKDKTEIERCEWYKLRNERLRGQLLDRLEVEIGIKALTETLTGIVRGSTLAKVDQADILNEMHEAVNIAARVAEKQIRDLMGKVQEVEEVEPAQNDEDTTDEE